MNGLIELNRLILAIIYTVPAIALSTAMATFLAYWFFIGRHVNKATEKEVEALRIMQDIKVGLKLRSRRSDIEPEATTTNEENHQ